MSGGYWVHGSPGGQINKIDNEATDGLSGTEDSLAYRVHEIERHLHSYESWFADAASPSGETHVADRISPTDNGAFVIDAGNDTWGGWLQILGSSDTPTRAGNVYFDLHRILFTATEKNALYYFQLAYGEDADAAVTAGNYTEVGFVPASNQIDSGPVNIQTRRENVGTKVWARCMAPGEDTGTMSFIFGLHEYEG